MKGVLRTHSYKEVVGDIFVVPDEPSELGFLRMTSVMSGEFYEQCRGVRQNSCNARDMVRVMGMTLVVWWA